MPEYSSREMMAIAAARLISDGDIVFCGTGISMLAAMAAKYIHAPNSVLFFETGAIDSNPEEMPMAVGDSRVMYRTIINGGLADAFAYMQNPWTGKRVVGVLGAAQIDPYGNLNSTVIGDYFHPRVRFSGSGGACDVASFVGRTIIFLKHEKRKFVPKLDYLTSPGWLSGGDTRVKAGLSPHGPHAVISDLGRMAFHEKTKRMYLAAYYEGVDVEHVLENTGFDLDVSHAEPMAPPTGEELSILRSRRGQI